MVMTHANTFGGYWIDITRTYIVDESTEKQAHIRHCDVAAAPSSGADVLTQFEAEQSQPRPCQEIA